LAAQHHIGVAFVAEPMWETLVFKDSRHAPWHRVLAEVAAERGAVFIDPAPAFAGRLDDNLWATWIHPTAKGNRLMAEALAPALEAAIASREALSFREDW
jgi:lysophospholipase L1-like esterase